MDSLSWLLSLVEVEPSLVQNVGITDFGSYIEKSGGINLLLACISAYLGNDYRRGGFIYEKTNGPVSMGELMIENRDPADNTNVTFNYFSAPEDVEKCVNGLQIILRAIETEAFAI